MPSRIDNTETLATLGSHDTGRRQQNKKNKKTQTNNKISNTDLP